MDRTFFILGAVLAGLSVGIGAFGAHGLRDRVDAALLANFETGARYHMYHALALFAVAWAVQRWPTSPLPPIAGWLMVAGIALFAGSLYAMALTGQRWLGAVTPFGGVAFLIAWGLLAYTAWRGA
ncbi:MAG TPA: DUF423 domain-containing protein [Anaerolineales bacterium]|nr:DUF423 domain-containing protein [Anaerolineales bacterium]HRF49322.1 DUF423 domain-containing protein [Anaerolineales bacterium]